jgi:hypothetical protein
MKPVRKKFSIVLIKLKLISSLAKAIIIVLGVKFFYNTCQR